jgi:hypothetical protein
MENIYKSFTLDKLNSKDDFKKYDINKPKNKPDFISIIILIISFALIIPAFLVHPIFYAGTILGILIAYYVYKRTISKRRRKYAIYLERQLKKEAKENNMLSLNEIYPVFLYVNDDSEEFKIVYQNDIKLYCKFNDFKNYIIYYNDLEHKTKKKLPDVPITTVKKYIMEIYFKDDEKLTITFDNRNPRFVINNRWFYQQFTNSQMINALAKIIDQIIKRRNK